MPNWCDNSVTIIGPKDQLERVRQGIKEGKLFETFVPIPADFPEGITYSSLWGTKWDLPKEDYTVHDRGTVIDLGFMSAWSPPIDVYFAMEADGLTIYAKYFEGGMAFYGYFDHGSELTKPFNEFNEIPDDIVEQFGLEDWTEEPTPE